MQKTALLLTVILVIASVGMVPQVANGSDDKWPGGYSCGDEAPIINDGTISGKLGSNGDIDMFKIRLQQGQYVKLTTKFTQEKPQNPTIQFGGIYTSDQTVYFGNNINIRGILNGNAEDSPGHPDDTIYLDENSQVHRFEIWAITDKYSENGLCISVADSGWKTPYKWELTIERSNPDVTLFEARQLEDQVVSLRNQLEQKNRSISDLKSRISKLEQRDNRISELKSLLKQKNQTIRELESQSINGSSGNVTIQATVNPANGQQNFVQGSKAIVHAESENADVSEMKVKYGAGEYQLDPSGKVAIPLADAGNREMTLIYGETTKQVSINVQSQEDQTHQDQQETTTMGGNGPGLGVATAVIALVAGAILLGRFR